MELDAQIQGLKLSLGIIINSVIGDDTARERAAANLHALALNVNLDAPQRYRLKVQRTMHDLAELLVEKKGP